MRLTQRIHLRQSLKDQPGYAVAGHGVFLVALRIKRVHAVMQ